MSAVAWWIVLQILHALPGALVALAGSAWYIKNLKGNWLADLLVSLAGPAVQRLETEVVIPAKQAGTWDDKTKAATAATAADIISDNMASIVREAAPHAIEAVIAGLKPKPKASKLPAAVKSLLGKTPIILLLACCAATSMACNTTLRGWLDANADTCEFVAVQTMTLLAPSIKDVNRDEACVIGAGTVMALKWRALAPMNLDLGVRAKRAIQAGDDFAKHAFPDVVAERSLAAVVVETLKLPIATSDAEALIGLLEAAKRTSLLAKAPVNPSIVGSAAPAAPPTLNLPSVPADGRLTLSLPAAATP